MAEYQADIIIVGAGVAGLLVAYRLAQAGASVIVLEAGPRVNRAEALRTYRGAVAKVPESPYPGTELAPRPSVLGLTDYYVQPAEGMQFKSTYIRRVGGTTWHWLGTAMRHVPNDFRLKSLYGVGEDWPIAYDDLAPWYDAAEKELGVAGDDRFAIGSPRSNGYPLPPLGLTYLDRHVGLAAARLGLEVTPTPQARNSLTYDGRPACCASASCVPICPVQAKYDATVHADKAERLGVQIVANAVADFVEVGNDGLISGIRVKRPDMRHEWARGRLYVLAAHAIETPKLLLISQQEGWPNGVANSSDAVGRYLMDHPVQLSWALAREPLFPFRSPLEMAGIENYRDGAFRSRHAGFRMAIGEDGWSFPGTPPPVLATELIGEGLRGAALVQELRERTKRQFRFANLIEQMPLAENRITPAFDQLDSAGIPRPKIDYRLDPLTEAGMRRAIEVANQIFDAVGVTFREHGKEHEGAGHVIGTYRMGNDPATSVVDRLQRAHDHANLFMVGSGVFPTAGTANPTLTLAALALWAADTMRAELRAPAGG